jgi:hypothetical protein
MPLRVSRIDEDLAGCPMDISIYFIESYSAPENKGDFISFLTPETGPSVILSIFQSTMTARSKQPVAIVPSAPNSGRRR